jgi:hypothetical protein
MDYIELRDDNEHFLKSYEKSENMKQLQNKNSRNYHLQESPFEELKNLYKSRGYEIPDLSVKENLFQPSPLLLENCKVQEYYKSIKGHTLATDKDLTFLEKMSNTFAERQALGATSAFKNKNDVSFFKKSKFASLFRNLIGVGKIELQELENRNQELFTENRNLKKYLNKEFGNEIPKKIIQITGYKDNQKLIKGKINQDMNKVELNTLNEKSRNHASTVKILSTNKQSLKNCKTEYNNNQTETSSNILRQVESTEKDKDSKRTTLISMKTADQQSTLPSVISPKEKYLSKPKQSRHSMNLINEVTRTSWKTPFKTSKNTDANGKRGSFLAYTNINTNPTVKKISNNVIAQNDLLGNIKNNNDISYLTNSRTITLESNTNTEERKEIYNNKAKFFQKFYCRIEGMDLNNYKHLLAKYCKEFLGLSKNQIQEYLIKYFRKLIIESLMLVQYIII